ncbi:DNA-J related domain-containing protein [Thiohalophilus sp.]|uniref:DNA-J related domain-containing protein n=1 Tax=Thiohalophilus sp. TaxID=3028392 RepID=UPI002ACD3689|nr:DNA-J related domain-containing protein [Thiohalophilus sp.]MDZ7662653.1 DNA-J related domain-containing protein [Thiohalophilus sp.]
MPVHHTSTEGRLPDAFYIDLEVQLKRYPDGISEYALLKELKARGYFAFLSDRPAAPDALFKAHFLLFHALYRLQKTCYFEKKAFIDIGPLNICLRDYQPGEAALTTPDNLAAYYLDLANLDNTSTEDVEALLATFWREYTRFDNRVAALAELGLADPVDETTIKQAYRRLAMLHHPDRGGEARRLQTINAAYETLCKSRF